MVRTSAAGRNEELIANKRTMMAYHNVLFSFCYIINSCEQNFAYRIDECDNKKIVVPLECCRALAMVALKFLSKNHEEGYNTSMFNIKKFFREKPIAQIIYKNTYKDVNEYFKSLVNCSAKSEEIINDCLSIFFNDNDFNCIVDVSTINQDENKDNYLLMASNILENIIMDKKSSGSIITLLVNIIFLKQLLSSGYDEENSDFQWLKNMWLRLCYMLYGEEYFSYKNNLYEYQIIKKEYKYFKKANPHLLLKEPIDPKKDLRAKIKFIYLPIRQKFDLSEVEIEKNLFSITHSLFKMRECHESVPKDSIEFIKSVIMNKLFNYTKIAKTSKDSIIGNCLDNYYYIFSKSIDIKISDIDEPEQKKNAQ